MFWFLQHLRKLPDVAGWTEAGRNPLVSRAHERGDGQLDRGQFLGGGDRPPTGLSLGDRLMCMGYSQSMSFTYSVARSPRAVFCLAG